MADFVDDQLALLPTKVDAKPVPVGANPANFTLASDTNSLSDWAGSLRTALLGGKVHGLRSVTSAPTGVVGRVQSFMKDGVLKVIQGAGTPGVEQIVLKPTVVDLRDWVGADPSGNNVSTSYINAAIAQAGAVTAAGRSYGMLRLSGGTYAVDDTLLLNAIPGILVVGDGKWSTVLKWVASSSKPFIQILNSQNCTFRDFAMEGSTTNKPTYMIDNHFNVGLGGGYVITNNTFENLNIGWSNTAAKFTTGIGHTYEGNHGGGNNSDCTYKNVIVVGAVNTAWSLQGDQCRAHRMENCSAVYGQYAVRTNESLDGQGGSFEWNGGNLGGITKCCFYLGAPTDKIIIRGVTAEGNNRFVQDFDMDAGITGSGTTNASPLFIEGNLFDGLTMAADGNIIGLKNTGPVTIRKNNFGSGSASVQAKIALGSNNQHSNVTISENYFNVSGSVYVSPINYFSGNPKRFARLKANTYLDNTGNVQHRMDELDIGPVNGTWSFYAGGEIRRHRIPLVLALSAIKANSTTQTFTFPLPAHCQVRAVHALVYAPFAGAGVTTCKVGSSAGGAQYLVAFNIDGPGGSAVSFGTKKGLVSGDLGTALSGIVQGGDVGFYWNDPAPSVYVTITGTTNLGNGTVTNLTTGQMMFLLDVEQWETTPF